MIHINCKIIGLTGGIASGKSTVSSILKRKGYKVIDADIIAREIVEINKPAYLEIVNYFGTSILNKDKSIDRKKLGEIVFSDKKLLEKLNSITHPYIFKSMVEKIEKNCDNNLIFLDIPLLFEQYDKLKKHNIVFDEIWLIYVDEETQIQRLMKRNKFTMEEAKRRIKAQIPLDDKINLSTRIIDNRGEISDLENNVEILLKELK